jgi:hypothetical protein
MTLNEAIVVSFKVPYCVIPEGTRKTESIFTTPVPEPVESSSNPHALPRLRSVLMVGLYFNLRLVRRSGVLP